MRCWSYALASTGLGLSALDRSAGRAIALPAVIPFLLTLRATALVAVGRHDAAEVELAVLERDCTTYPSKQAVFFTTRLLQAVSARDTDRAVAIARSRPADLPIDPHYELLADALLAVHTGAVDPVLTTLASWPEGARWLERFAPSVCESLRSTMQ